MTIDPGLLEQAKTAGEELADAEKQVLLSRADYHTAIRRLHLGGASLRDIAESLSMSHQRVQQIVQGAGGTWWSRVWKTRRTPPDAVCTWCGRSPREVAKLIAGPRVFICDRCIDAAEKTAAGRPVSDMRMLTGRAGSACSFCGKRANDRRSVVRSDAGNVCVPCLTTCREILNAADATNS